MELQKGTKHTYVSFTFRNGEELETVTRTIPGVIGDLISSTKRDDRFIRIENVFGQIEIVNIDNVVSVIIDEHEDETDEEE
jgi:hypothetical protein